MESLTSPHGGNIYKARRILKREVSDFSANINPLGLPSKVKAQLIRELERRTVHYPDPEGETLCEKIAHYWNIQKENIALGNGSVELIYRVFSLFNPKSVLIVEPTFSEYERAAKQHRTQIRFSYLREEEGFSLPVLPESESIFIGNPNNPTGNLLLRSQRFPGKFPEKFLFIDEAFLDFVDRERALTFIPRATQNKKILVLRTFTKFFALPGLRLGYLVGHPEIIKKLRELVPPWSVNALAQLAGEMLLEEKKYIQETRRVVKEERDFLYQAILKTKGLKPYRSVTNFLLVKIEKEEVNSCKLAQALFKEGILVRDCCNFRKLGDKFFRIAIRARNENLKFIKTLQKFF
jgi:threonine-phosphate decarboxylase